MNDTVCNRLIPPAAAAASRRASLFTRVRAGLAAVVAPAMATATKAARGVRERGERQRERCRAYFERRCQGSDDCLEALLPCCEPFAECYGAAGIEWPYPT